MKFNDLKRMIIRPPCTQRFVEIDLLRGLAILLMIFGHILWDLDYFGLVPMNNGIYSALQKTVPPLFFLLVGMSLIVSKKKTENNPEKDENIYYKNLVLRGLKIFSLGMMLTIGSILFMPEKVVFFGVLHCIGLSIALSAAFLKYRKYLPTFTMLSLMAGWGVLQYNMQNPTLFHLIIGLRPANVWSFTLDYFPLLPWFGFVLLGILIGDVLYEGTSRRFRMPDLSKYKPIRIFEWCGQHSLLLYLLHQPIIGGVLSLLVLL